MTQPFPEAAAGAVLTVDLDALVANWRLMKAQAPKAECAAVVKADGYGLGAAKVGPALWRAGCRAFFVAHAAEGAALRASLPDARILILNGLVPGCEAEYHALKLEPVLNHLGEAERWAALGRSLGTALPAVLHVDTGMNRLGLPESELAALTGKPERLDGIALGAVMSHLACADEPEHGHNRVQLAAFGQALRALRAATGQALPGSLAASSGIFLGPQWHFDLLRPGVALYGGNPVPGAPNPMAPVVRLDARILQVRDVDSPMTVGYGATHRINRQGRIATVAVGYADGFLRSASNRASGFVDGFRVPLAGRVSMDLITFDVSAVPSPLAQPGEFIQLIGPDHTVDDLAAEAGTIGYEILTSLGRRYHRRYIGEGCDDR